PARPLDGAVSALRDSGGAAGGLWGDVGQPVCPYRGGAAALSAIAASASNLGTLPAAADADAHAEDHVPWLRHGKRVTIVIRLLVNRSGGAERIYCELANMLAARDYEVTCL